MRKKKIISTLLVSLILVMCFCNVALAAGDWAGKIDPSGGAGSSEAENAMNIIIGIFQVVAVGVAAIMLIALAVKYMSAAPGEKAEIKKHAVVYIVGAVMAFGSAGVVQLLKTFAEEALKA